MARGLEGIGRRTAAAIGLVLVVAVTLHAVVVVRAVFARSAVTLREVFDPVPEAQIDRCEADPEHFVARGEAWVAYGYPRGEIRSLNPDAPVLDARLMRLHQLGWTDPARLFRHGEWGGAVAWHTGREGPCATIVLRWSRDVERRDDLWWLSMGNLALVTTLASLIAFLLLVRPIARRIRRLANAAERVGTADYASPGPSTDDLGVLARVLDEAHDRVRADQEAEVARRRALEQHLSNVAHDLRTPLASLQLRLESMPAVEGVEDALGDVVYLTMLTQNLHLAAHLEGLSGRPDARADLGSIARRVTARFGVIGRRRGQAVDGATPDAPVWVVAEAVHVEQAVANLVHNALVHTPAGSHVAVVVAVGESGFTLTVSDDGPGIAPEALERLLARHGRGSDARTRHGEGQGLGLAIVAEVCDRAGWMLDFAARDGGGLVVTIAGALATRAS